LARHRVHAAGQRLDASLARSVLFLESLLGHSELGQPLLVVKLNELFPLLVGDLPDEAARPSDGWQSLLVCCRILVEQAIHKLGTAL
jgi:hypothetical protein